MNRELDRTWWNEARLIARRHARGASDAADDLAQELAVAALERDAPAERPGAWLECVGRNAAIDRARVERRRHELAAGIVGPAAAPDPEAGALARERRGMLRRALLALPRPLRRATLARFHAELSFEDVAARLGTPPATARTRVHRALARLRDRLGALRAVLVGWQGAQATLLGVAVVTAMAQPFNTQVVSVSREAAPVARPHGRRVARAARAPVAASFPALAAAPARASIEGPPRSIPAAPVARFAFDDDVVDGDLARPDGVVVLSDVRVQSESLIELRRQFVPELLKTLEDL
jgi:RNA polymerase sigma factor (sigma-70 family)